MSLMALFLIWVLRPLFKKKNSRETKDTINRILNSGQNNLKQTNNIFIITIIITLIALAFWLLPKLGINFLGLIQKIIPLVSSLRGILPF